MSSRIDVVYTEVDGVSAGEVLIDGRELRSWLRQWAGFVPDGDVLIDESEHRDGLLGAPVDGLPPGRAPIYVCSACGGLDCGTLTAAVALSGDVVTWSSFAWEDTFREPVNDMFVEVPPIVFERSQYEQTIRDISLYVPPPGRPSRMRRWFRWGVQRAE